MKSGRNLTRRIHLLLLIARGQTVKRGRGIEMRMLLLKLNHG